MSTYPEKRCGNCGLKEKDKDRCILKNRPVHPNNNSCTDHEYDEATRAKIDGVADEVLNSDREAPPETNETSSETNNNGDRSKVKKRTKAGGRKSKIDLTKLKQLYNENIPYKEMTKQLGVSSQGTVSFHVNKLIESGELIKRKERQPKRTTKPVTKQPTNEQSGKVTKLTSPRETPINAEPAGSATKDKSDIQDDTSNDDLRYTKDLMQGAEKIVIYHKNLKHTIEFNKKGE